MEVTEFLTWDVFGTAAGLALATWILIAFLKQVLGKYWTELVNNIGTYLIAVGILVSANIANGAEWQSYVLAVFNAAVVFLAVKQLGSKDLPTFAASFKEDKPKKKKG